MYDVPFLDDSHRKLASHAEAFARGRVREEFAGEDERHARGLVEALARGGLLDYTAGAPGPSPRLDVRALCVIRERLSYESGLADLMFAMQGLGSFPITLAGSSELKARYLPAVRAGEYIAAFAITEPGAGSDVAAMKTSARRSGDDYVLNGEKTFISNAGLADFYTVFAKTEPDRGHKGISAFVVEKDAPGFSVKEKLELIAPHPVGRLAFEDCRVPASSLVGSEGDGFKIAMSTLDTFRPTVGAAAAGLAWRALDEAISYAKRRVQFGRPIAEFQSTQMKLAEMATEMDAARLLI